MRALLIGGSQDGVVMEVPMATSTIEGVQPPKMSLAERLDELIEPIPTVRYERRVIELWDVSIPVYVLPDWPVERIEATLARVLLSDVAHVLSEEA